MPTSLRSGHDTPAPTKQWSAVGVGQTDRDDLDEESPRSATKSASDFSWSSQASHTLRRSRVCSLGLFQMTA